VLILNPLPHKTSCTKCVVYFYAKASVPEAFGTEELPQKRTKLTVHLWANNLANASNSHLGAALLKRRGVFCILALLELDFCNEIKGFQAMILSS
jgi:hypothetical protein